MLRLFCVCVCGCVCAICGCDSHCIYYEVVTEEGVGGGGLTWQRLALPPHPAAMERARADKYCELIPLGERNESVKRADG